MLGRIEIFLFISNILVLFRVSELGLDFINYRSLGIFCETVFGKRRLYTL